MPLTLHYPRRCSRHISVYQDTLCRHKHFTTSYKDDEEYRSRDRCLIAVRLQYLVFMLLLLLFFLIIIVHTPVRVGFCDTTIFVQKSAIYVPKLHAQ
jgi:hypothetical protein